MALRLLQLATLVASVAVASAGHGSPWPDQYTQQAQALLAQMNLTVSNTLSNPPSITSFFF